MAQFQVAICQFQPRKGAIQANLDRIEARFKALGEDPSPPDLLIYPEAALSGYLLEGGVAECSLEAATLARELELRHRRSGAPPVDLCLGFYEWTGSQYCNSALWLSLGGSEPGIRQVQRKLFLPTYGLFDEGRFVSEGSRIAAFETRFGRVAILVCEDLWHSLVPTIAALDGAQLLVTIAAGPGRGIFPGSLPEGWPESQQRWEELARTVAAEHGIWLALAQLCGFEAGKAFPGGSLLVGPDGVLRQRGPLFAEAELGGVVDLAEVARVRAQSPLLADLRSRLPLLLDQLQRVDRPRLTNAAPATANARATSVAFSDSTDSLPSLPNLSIDPELTRRWLVAFLREEFRLKGFERAVVALSGGLDSVLVTWLAVEAFGAGQVTALRLPSRDSHPDSLAHARQVTELLGIRERTVQITQSIEGYLATLSERPSPARIGNLMARYRMAALFDLGAELQALPLGTGNKSERLMGYFTWHGDDAPPVNPIGDLYKTQVRALAAHLGIPEEILTKAPSADLIEGQTDEGDLGIGYDRADPILEALLRGYSESALLRCGVTPTELKLVQGRLESTHWKRRLPTVATLSNSAIGEFYLRPVDYQAVR